MHPIQRLNRDVVLRDEDDGMTLAFNRATNRAILLNATARFVVDCVCADLSPQEIGLRIAATFKVPPSGPTGAELERLIAQHIDLLGRTGILGPAEDC